MNRLQCLLGVEERGDAHARDRGGLEPERGEHAVFAHIVISGTVETTDARGKMLFGPGSVFGMAEGLADVVFAWDAVATSVVSTKLIPLDRALREVRRLNAGLKGICRFTTMRILDLKAPPATLS